MKNAMVAGAIAGLVSGIVSSISISVGISIGLYGSGIVIPTTYPASSAIAMVVLTLIFGTILGLFYSKFYDVIPGKSLRKGLCFGLMVWFVKDIMAGAYVTFAMPIEHPLGIFIGINLIVAGFYMWIIYGLVIGVLYKK